MIELYYIFLNLIWIFMATRACDEEYQPMRSLLFLLLKPLHWPNTRTNRVKFLYLKVKFPVTRKHFQFVTSRGSFVNYTVFILAQNPPKTFSCFQGESFCGKERRNCERIAN